MSSTRTGTAPLSARLGLPTTGRLARRAARGDKGAFEEIFRRYHQELYRYCVAIVRNPEDAQDAVQATMAAALRALPGEDREIALRPWLYRVAHNESISLLRVRGQVVDPARGEEARSLPPETELADRDRLRRLITDIRELPDRQRSAIVMRELSDLSYEEIGRALSCAEASARQTVYEARQALHEFEEGREMECEAVREAISAGDRRRLRGRRITAHLRSCDGCLAFEASIAQRRNDLQILCPPLPALAAAGLLGGLIGGSGAGAGGAGVAAVGAGGTGAAGVAGAAGVGVGGSLAVKGASLAAAVVVAAGAADIGGVIDLRGPSNGGGQSQTAGPGGGSNGGGPAADDEGGDAAARSTSDASTEDLSTRSDDGRAGDGGKGGQGAAGAGRRAGAPTGGGDSASAAGQTAPDQSGSSSGKSESAPGHSGTGSGNSANAPGHSGSGRGGSANAPGGSGNGSGSSTSKADDKDAEAPREPKEAKEPKDTKEPKEAKEPKDDSAPATPETKPEPAGGSSSVPGGGKPPVEEPPTGGPADSEKGPKPK